MIRVQVIAESSIARAGLEAMLREESRFEVVAERERTALLDAPTRGFTAGAGAEVVLAEVGDKHHLALLLSQIRKRATAAVLLADELNRGELLRALHAGARAILHRDASASEIFAGIEAAAAGLTVLGPDEVEMLVPPPASAGEDDLPGEPLTAREAEVLALMAQGLANKEIAARLNVSEHTVKFHVSSILAKLGVSSRTEAVTRSLREGLLLI